MQPIVVSENRRFLKTQSGEPFFWLGDTAWEIFHRLTREDALKYLDIRRDQGFNLIQAVALAEFDGLKIPNTYGEVPLIDLDPAKPNDAYFQHVDFIVRAAAERGLVIGFLPTWGDKVLLPWGVGPVIFNPDNARVYGEYLGRRYRKADNIIWVLGGDRDGTGFAPLWGAMAAGIAAGLGRRPLTTLHPCGVRGSSEWFHDEEWLDVNMWQSGHGQEDSPVWEMITKDYNRTPVKPVLDGEPNYEDHPIDPWSRKWEPKFGRFSDYDVRKQFYRSVFAGACGGTYGHHTMWQFYQPSREPVNFPAYFWDEAIYRPGARQLIHLKKLMLSRPYFTRIPDQGLILSDAGLKARHMRATRDSNGSYAFVYVPTADQMVEVNLAKLAGNLTAWWYDPRAGASHRIGEFANRGSAKFTSPLGGPDWVLVLDVKEKGYPEPGTSVAV